MFGNGPALDTGEPLVPLFWLYRNRVMATPGRGTSHRGARVQRGAAAVAQVAWEPRHEMGWEMLEMLPVEMKGRRRCSLGSRGSRIEFLQPRKPLKIKGRAGQDERM